MTVGLSSVWLDVLSLVLLLGGLDPALGNFLNFSIYQGTNMSECTIHEIELK
jgi:hypothetical protein